MEEEVIVLYQPTVPCELKLVEQSGYKKWPPRLPGQPIFHPLTNEQSAIELASTWNKDTDVGYVTRFAVKKSFICKYRVSEAGISQNKEWWVPAEELEELNKNIVGLIEVIGEFRKPPSFF